MRTVFSATCLLLFCLFAPAAAHSQSPAPHSWALVQALPAGSKVHIKFFHHSKTDCRVTRVDADTIACDTSATFNRVDISAIRANHRVRSTVVGVALGYGIAFGFTAAATRAGSCSTGCAATVGIADLGILIATPIISHITDFTAGTLYKAPTAP